MNKDKYKTVVKETDSKMNLNVDEDIPQDDENSKCKVLTESEECPICYESKELICKFKCSHKVCKECFQKQLTHTKNNLQCCYCRSKINTDNLTEEEENILKENTKKHHEYIDSILQSFGSLLSFESLIRQSQLTSEPDPEMIYNITRRISDLQEELETNIFREAPITSFSAGSFSTGSFSLRIMHDPTPSPSQN